MRWGLLIQKVLVFDVLGRETDDNNGTLTTTLTPNYSIWRVNKLKGYCESGGEFFHSFDKELLQCRKHKRVHVDLIVHLLKLHEVNTRIHCMKVSLALGDLAVNDLSQSQQEILIN